MSRSFEPPEGVPAVRWDPLPSGSSQVHSPRGSIVGRLIGYTEAYWPSVRAENARKPKGQKANVLVALLEFVQRTTGISAHELDQAMVLRRVGWRMRVNGVDTLDAYRALLESDPVELPALRKSLFIRVTDFFRDPNLYFHIERRVLPELFSTAGEEGLRILVHGCGTGEEAYSLAMLIDAYMRKVRQRLPVRILANDADKNALIHARRGFYPHLITADLSALCLDQFFEATKEGYCVIERIRSMVRFMPGHEDDPAAYSGLNLLVARNPLLFGDDSVEDQLLATFFSRLREGGMLIVDPSLQKGYITKYFDALDAGLGIFRRKKSVGRPGHPEGAGRQHPENRPALRRYLEEALYHTRERLNMAVIEYETTHDDLVDLNHELQASMRSVVLEKDQLQAEHTALLEMKNAVLRTNKTFKKQCEGFQRSLARLQAVLAQCGVGLLGLNDRLEIEMFTPDVGALFDMTRSDIGRPIASVRAPFRWDMEEAAAGVLRTRTPVEKEITTESGPCYRIVINPLEGDDGEPGIVCTFIDVTEQRRAREWDRYKAGVLDQFPAAVLVTNSSLRVTFMNRAAVERYGLFNQRRAGMTLGDLYRCIWPDAASRDAAHRTLREKGCWAGELVHETPDGTRQRVLSTIRTLMDEAGQEMGLLTIVQDVRHLDGEDAASMRALISDLERRSVNLDRETMKMQRRK